MNDEPDLFDRPVYGTDPRKLVRSDAPATSFAAAYGVDTTKLERLVHRDIAAAGPDGCIAADVLSLHPGMPYSSITARFAALASKRLISCGPDTRPGPSGRRQRVMRSLQSPAEKESGNARAL